MSSRYDPHRQRAIQLQLNRRRALGLATGATAAGLLVACGSHGKRTATTPKGSSQSGQPRSGGQFNGANSTEPFSWDPAAKLVTIADYLGLVYDTLVDFKTGAAVKYYDQTLVPALAQSWETPDAQSYTFHLEKSVKFADLPPVNGRALTSADVKWSFEYLTRTGDFKTKGLPPSQTAGLFQGLDRVETPDSSTVVMHFAQPFIPFLTYGATEFASIVPHEIFDQDGGYTKHAVGTGPWQWDENDSQRGARAVMKRNPSYFQSASGRPYLDQLNWLILPDDATMNAAFISRQIDILDYLGTTYDTVVQVQKSIPTAAVQEYVDLNCGHIYINVTKPPLDDVRVRKALALSIDRDEFMKAVSNGRGQWAVSGSLPSLFTQDEAKQLLKPDPAQAKRLLSDAGHQNGVDIEFIYPGVKYGQQLVTKLQLLQAQVKQTGINLALKSLDTPTEDNRRRSGDFQLAVTPTELAIAGDIDGPLYVVYHPKSTSNYGKVNDPVLTPLLEEQRREVDVNKRKDVARQAARRINDQAWGISLYYPPGYVISQSYVKNYAKNVGYYHAPLTNTWLEK